MYFSEKDCTNQELCSKCQGRCCKETGCFYMPEDFEKIEFTYLKNQIAKRRYISIAVITQVLGMPIPNPILYLKIRNEGADICDISTKGQCMLLTPEGCKLSFKNRPSGGKALIPTNGWCHSKLTPVDVMQGWKPYQTLLKRLWCEFTDYTIEEKIRITIAKYNKKEG